MTTESTPPSRPLRKHGPTIRMTESEYAHVKKEAKKAGRPCASYIRDAMLECDIPDFYSEKQMKKLRGVGKWLNGLVHRLHIDPQIKFGITVDRSKIYYSDIWKRVRVVEDTINALPKNFTEQTDWLGCRIDPVPRGAGARKMQGIVRCTPTEHEAIKSLASLVGLSESAYLRAVVLGHPIGRKAHYAVIRQLERIENNIHQLLHMENIFWSLEMGFTLGGIERDINDLVFRMSSGSRRDPRQQIGGREEFDLWGE